MKIYNDLTGYFREFKQHWLGYLMLLLGLDLFNQIIVIPLFRYVTTFILQASAIPLFLIKILSRLLRLIPLSLSF